MGRVKHCDACLRAEQLHSIGACDCSVFHALNKFRKAILRALAFFRPVCDALLHAGKDSARVCTALLELCEHRDRVIRGEAQLLEACRVLVDRCRKLADVNSGLLTSYSQLVECLRIFFCRDSGVVHHLCDVLNGRRRVLSCYLRVFHCRFRSRFELVAVQAQSCVQRSDCGPDVPKVSDHVPRYIFVDIAELFRRIACCACRDDQVVHALVDFVKRIYRELSDTDQCRTDCCRCREFGKHRAEVGIEQSACFSARIAYRVIDGGYDRVYYFV